MGRPLGLGMCVAQVLELRVAPAGQAQCKCPDGAWSNDQGSSIIGGPSLPQASRRKATLQTRPHHESRRASNQLRQFGALVANRASALDQVVQHTDRRYHRCGTPHYASRRLSLNHRSGERRHTLGTAARCDRSSETFLPLYGHRRYARAASGPPGMDRQVQG